jgi:DNA-binding NarL/FixJ family response regulator
MYEVKYRTPNGKWTYRTKADTYDRHPSHEPMMIEERERRVLFATRAGKSARQISHELGITDRTVSRIRARLRDRGELN